MGFSLGSANFGTILSTCFYKNNLFGIVRVPCPDYISFTRAKASIEASFWVGAPEPHCFSCPPHPVAPFGVSGPFLMNHASTYASMYGISNGVSSYVQYFHLMALFPLF